MNSRKDLTPFTVIGASYSHISLSLVGSISIVSVEKSIPRNLTLGTSNTHFSSFRKRLFSLSLSMTR